MHKRLLILGSRGVPAQYGEKESLAEELALHLVQKGWRVTVYCQEDWGRTVPYETMWGRVRRVHIPVKQTGSVGQFMFCLKSVLHARKQASMALMLGDQHAFLTIFQRLRGKIAIFHLGSRPQLNPHSHFFSRMWARFNEKMACLLGDYFIVDNAAIVNDFQPNITKDNSCLIPSGALAITDASTIPLRQLGLESGKYVLVDALAQPENSLLEIVQAFSQAQRQHQLVVVGALDDDNPYHQRVLVSASNEVKFIGPIHDKTTLRALRYHSLFSVHGHQLGGTSLGLVESLAAGSPVIAFDTPSTRWVCAEAALYFNDSTSCAAQMHRLLNEPELGASLKQAARLRHAELFTLDNMLAAYERVLTALNPYQPQTQDDTERRP